MRAVDEAEATPLFTEEQMEAIAYALAGLRREWKRDIRRLERKIVKQFEGGDVIDLPKNFWRRDAA